MYIYILHRKKQLLLSREKKFVLKAMFRTANSARAGSELRSQTNKAFYFTGTGRRFLCF